MRHLLYILPIMTLLLVACRDEDIIYIPEQVEVARPEYTGVTGLYVLNEGNMNDNKASLDFYDYSSGTYRRNIFPEANPHVTQEMGDVGNDIGIYGDKLYAVINCSNKIDVLDKRTAVKLGQINIPNCRYIAFKGGYAYVTSYVGPVSLTDDRRFQNGAVLKVDTVSLNVVDTCYVGRQPDGIEIVDDLIYVANSGGYTPERYESTVSVIDLYTFKEIERIEVAPNLQHIKSDRRGILWITSRGDYYNQGSGIYAYDTRKRRMVTYIDTPVSSTWLDGDSLYVVSAEWSYLADNTLARTYKIIDTDKQMVVNNNFIADGTDAVITLPYGVAVHPITKDIYIGDARDYIHPGRLYCFDRNGVKKWDVRTGDIPGHFVFLGDYK